MHIFLSDPDFTYPNRLLDHRQEIFYIGVLPQPYSLLEYFDCITFQHVVVISVFISFQLELRVKRILSEDWILCLVVIAYLTFNVERSEEYFFQH